MQYSLLDNFGIAETRLIDWYDGVVSALARIDGATGWFYVSLVAWSPDLGEKVFALVPIGDQCERRLSALLSITEGDKQERWQAIQKEVSRLRGECRGNACLIRCRELGEPLIAATEIDIDALRGELGQDAEAACGDDQIEKWFGLSSLQRAKSR